VQASSQCDAYGNWLPDDSFGQLAAKAGKNVAKAGKTAVSFPGERSIPWRTTSDEQNGDFMLRRNINLLRRNNAAQKNRTGCILWI
jgi:hypothetical protein